MLPISLVRKGIATAALVGSAVSLVGQELPLPVHRVAGSIPVMGWSCDAPRNAAEARRISLSAIDFARDSEGKVFLGYDQQFMIWAPRGMGLVLLGKDAAPGTVAVGASVAKVKSRNGQFWVQDPSRSRVLQWDAKASTWRVALDPGYEFQDFEVSFHGQIVLIGTFPSKKGEHRFLECFEAYGKSPVSTEIYPSSGLSPQDEKRCGFNWSFPVTSASDEFIICYFAMSGRLFVYDTSKHALREISTPWKPLDSERLSAQDREFGTLNMNAYPGPRCLQFVPTPRRNAIGIAYQVPGKAPRKYVLIDGKGTFVPVGADNEAEPVRVVELDFIDMKLESLASDAGNRLPVWLKPNGTYGPMVEVLKSTEGAPPPAKADATAGRAHR